MENVNKDLIPESVLNSHMGRRRQFLPIWIKIFAWIFLIFGLIVPIALIYGLLGYEFKSSLYGIETTSIISPTGICLAFLFAFKGIVAFGFLKEKKWAIKLGLTDAILGILLCCFTTIYSLLVLSNISLRLELIALIPYLIKLLKIKCEWENTLLK